MPAELPSLLPAPPDSFAGGEAPLHTSYIAEEVFAEMAAEGELSGKALSRLLALYDHKSLDAALALLVCLAPALGCTLFSHARLSRTANCSCRVVRRGRTSSGSKNWLP